MAIDNQDGQWHQVSFVVAPDVYCNSFHEPVVERREMNRFDAKALYQALDAQRQRRGMSWTDVSKEIGVSASTLRRTKDGGRMEVDGMIAMVYWLGEKVETFVRETPI